MDKETEKNLVLYLDMAEKSKQSGDLKSAIDYYEKFLSIDSTKSVVYNITADLYGKAYGYDGLEKQIQYYQKAYELKPSRLSVLGLAFCFEQAGKYYENLINNNPTETDLYNYALFLIHSGKMYEGHKYMTHRFNIDDINLKYPIKNTNKRWDLKTDIKDKTLLVHYEQGFGDTIMYCRFVPFLKNFAKKVIFVVQDELFELLKNSYKISQGIDIVSDKTNIENIDYDYDMALLDIPYVLKTEITNIPYADGYLDVFEKGNLIPNKKLKIGIANTGSKDANYNIRDIDLSEFKILKEKLDCDLYYLQKEEINPDFEITNLGKTFNNFSDTASAIKNMDLIISTDNVILNLSGALGVKTIGLFNKDTNYRWFKTKGNDVCWYNSTTPLQAETQDDWDFVIKEQMISIINSL